MDYVDVQHVSLSRGLPPATPQEVNFSHCTLAGSAQWVTPLTLVQRVGGSMTQIQCGPLLLPAYL